MDFDVFEAMTSCIISMNLFTYNYPSFYGNDACQGWCNLRGRKKLCFWPIRYYRIIIFERQK